MRNLNCCCRSVLTLKGLATGVNIFSAYYLYVHLYIYICIYLIYIHIFKYLYVVYISLKGRQYQCCVTDKLISSLSCVGVGVGVCAPLCVCVCVRACGCLQELTAADAGGASLTMSELLARAEVEGGGNHNVRNRVGTPAAVSTCVSSLENDDKISVIRRNTAIHLLEYHVILAPSHLPPLLRSLLQLASRATTGVYWRLKDAWHNNQLPARGSRV